MKVVGVCSLPKIPASEPGVPDSPAQIVAVCDDRSVFRHSTLERGLGRAASDSWVGSGH